MDYQRASARKASAEAYEVALVISSEARNLQHRAEKADSSSFLLGMTRVETLVREAKAL